MKRKHSITSSTTTPPIKPPVIVDLNINGNQSIGLLDNSHIVINCSNVDSVSIEIAPVQRGARNYCAIDMEINTPVEVSV